MVSDYPLRIYNTSLQSTMKSKRPASEDDEAAVKRQRNVTEQPEIASKDTLEGSEGQWSHYSLTFLKRFLILPCYRVRQSCACEGYSLKQTRNSSFWCSRLTCFRVEYCRSTQPGADVWYIESHSYVQFILFHLACRAPRHGYTGRTGWA